ncbi:hypothetical protein ACSVBT_12805 [Afipia sp. TerB]
MTAEVCIMNRLAVVLAADSAATVTQWSGNKVEERYFKGSNKIFQLSDYHPVGLMIFDSADVLRVPWEIVVKSFRAELGKKSFNTVKEYAEEFFDFLERTPLIFPSSIQDEVFLDTARTAAVLLTPRDHPKDDNARLDENTAIVESTIAELEDIGFNSTLDDKLLDEAKTSWTRPLVEHIEKWRETFEPAFPRDLSRLATAGILEVFKRPEKHFNTTGLVFAGFGDHEIFPSLVEYKSCGLMCGRHISIAADHFAVTHEVPAKLASFAQTAMSDTFSLGVSEDVYLSVMSTLENKLEEFAKSIAEESGGDAARIENFSARVAAARREMGEAILDRAQREHAMPLRRVLGVLPVDEMAELAETLINLQALKEKVTKSSETVGGPVDVAIITKNEGLVWVKRKHFFDVSLNSRYVLRQQLRLS